MYRKNNSILYYSNLTLSFTKEEFPSLLNMKSWDKFRNYFYKQKPLLLKVVTCIINTSKIIYKFFRHPAKNDHFFVLYIKKNNYYNYTRHNNNNNNNRDISLFKSTNNLFISSKW